VETPKLPEDTLNPMVKAHPMARAASAPARSVTMIMVVRQEAIPHAEAPASAAAMGAVAVGLMPAAARFTAVADRGEQKPHRDSGL
jgi:hypothetical protein